MREEEIAWHHLEIQASIEDAPIRDQRILSLFFSFLLSIKENSPPPSRQEWGKCAHLGPLTVVSSKLSTGTRV